MIANMFEFVLKRKLDDFSLSKINRVYSNGKIELVFTGDNAARFEIADSQIAYVFHDLIVDFMRERRRENWMNKNILTNL
jgi:hypothetical protein